ncbi:MAG: hypothetical protein CMK44_04445 [Porticoccus sp.]|nr:hypothetical protein [Porticoccus sp.]
MRLLNKNKMTFSWKELVCHGLLKKVGDPSLVKELLKVVMKEHRDHLEEEAREFHSENVGPAIDIFNIYMSSCPSLSRDDLVRLSPYTTPMIRYNNLKKELRWWWWEGGEGHWPHWRSHGGRWVLFN